MEKMKKYLAPAIGLVLGGLGGFLYWAEVGCSTGTCPITSSPYISTLYGAMVGVLIGSSFMKKEKKSE